MNKKTGTVIKILRDDYMALIREHATSTEYILFLEDLTKAEHEALRVNMVVTFERAPGHDQFVVMNLEINEKNLRKAI